MATVPGPDPNKPLPIPDAPAQEPPREEPERYEPAPRRSDDDPDFAPPERWTPEKEEEEVGTPTPL